MVKTTGDGLLAEFPSAVDALRCAMAIQNAMEARECDLKLRIGVNVGDVVIFEGVITLDKDFGAGYFYDVILEEAVLIK